ncbi:MAG: integration host factor subunit beta [Pseudomonadaceae bacterium]|nr:integration host factor subunit beta [Pseudomonadaceae bacterium]
MTKSELVQRLAHAFPGLHAVDLDRAVNVIFDEISMTLAEGGRAELRGFGSFSVRHRAPRKGRNPRTGAAVSVPAKKVPYFKAGKELRERVDTAKK